MALCGVESVNMLTNTIETLGIYCSCNKTLKNENKLLDHIVKIQKIYKYIENALFINIWNLALLEKIAIFKTLALSNIIHLDLT